MQLNHRVGNFEYDIPIGFRDDSNANDICASIYSEKMGLKVFIDHINPEEREVASYKRFSVYKVNECGEIEDSINDLVAESEEWLSIYSLLN